MTKDELLRENDRFRRALNHIRIEVRERLKYSADDVSPLARLYATGLTSIGQEVDAALGAASGGN